MNKKVWVGLGVVGLIALLAIGSLINRRNEMVRKAETNNATWAQVDVVLQRRADLIPNLVSTVKGIAAQEQTVFGDIANARAALLGAGSPAERIAANQQLDGVLGRLLAIVENYPQIRSSENFLRLQDELAGSENRIAIERRRYNEALRYYNAYIGLFPNDLIAEWTGFERNDNYFEAPAEAREVPKVEF